MPEYNRAGNIFIYFSVKHEPDTLKIIRRSLELGKKVLLPYVLPDGQMAAKVMTGFDDLVPDMYNIPSCPEGAETVLKENIEFAVIPGVAFDEKGYRIGQGGGYYDRFLSGYNGVSVGLCRGKMLQKRVIKQNHDLPVSIVVTENGEIRKSPIG